MYHLGTGIDSQALADGLAANGQTGYQSRHHERYRRRPGKAELLQDLRRNCRRSRAGHNAADITDHIVANRANALSIAKKPNGLVGTGYLPGRHGVKGLFISRGDRHAYNIKYDTDPGFVDIEGGNYSLNDDSRVYRDIPGFPKISYDLIGVISD